MPSITVNEIDNSRYVTANATAPMTVLIISTASFGPTFSATKPEVYTFNGASDLNNFYYTFGVAPAVFTSDSTTAPLDGDQTFEYVTNLLRSGATVKFCRINSGANAYSDDSLVTAKYSGTFGNRIVAEFTAIKTGGTTTTPTYSTTDAILNVYVANKDYQLGVNRTATVSYTTRVSTSSSSNFYIDNLDLKWVNVTVANLETIIGNISATTSTNHKVTYNLSNGTDYASAGTDAYTIATSIANALSNFSDSYLFSFDFVSAGGFSVSSSGSFVETKSATESFIIGTSDTSINLSHKGIVPGTLTCGTNTDTPASGELTGTITLTDGTTTVAGTVNYGKGTITFSSPSVALKSFELNYSYYNNEAVTGEAISITAGATSISLGGTHTGNLNILPGTVAITYTSGSTSTTATDTPSTTTTGTISLPIGTDGASVTATINYTTGVITFTAAVTALTGTVAYNKQAYTTYADKLNIAMYELCQTRGDAVALIDCTRGATYTETVDYAQNFDTSYAAMYAPWCKMTSSTTSVNIWAPPSLIFLKALLNGMSKEESPELWYIPAGVTRMSASFVIAPEYEIGSVILDAFQNTTDYSHLAKVNPIMNVRNYGYCIYGNSTLQKLVMGQGRSALESMNVRLIANVIKKHIFDVCSGLSFEYNNSQLWLKFYTQMDEKLLYMKRHYGLYDYKIVMDSTTVTQDAMNERRVPGKVLISPTLDGEYFDIDFEIVPAGVTFTEEG